MNITLRKANTVQLSINEKIKGLTFKTSVQINEFEDSSAQIDDVRSTFDSNIKLRTKLVDALYEIRKAVAQANAEQGISNMLADIARLEKDLQFFNIFATKHARLSDAVIEGKMEKIKNSSGENRLYIRSDTVDTDIFTKEEIEDFNRTLADLKRQKQKLQDTLLELNVRTDIVLAEETAQFLEEEDIL